MGTIIREFDSLDDAGKKRIEDAIFSAAKLGVSLIPVAGPVLSEVMGYMFSGPAQDRMTRYFQELDERLTTLLESGVVTMDELKSNDEFFNVLINAVPKALHSIEEAKRTAFRNTILNTALNKNPDEAKTQIFLNVLDNISAAHIEILYFFDNPRRWYLTWQRNIPTNWMTGSLQKVLLDAMPKYSEEREMIGLIWSDLKDYGFHRSGDLMGTMTAEGCFEPRTTLLGQEFIQFITYDDKT